MSRVKVVSKLTAVSSKPSGRGKIHKFTDSDRAMFGQSLHAVFYYKANIFNDFDLDPIRVSLSDTLSLYPPVTGRIVKNEDGLWEVACNDAGVRIVRARVGASLDEWLRSADGAEEEDLTVWEPMPEDPTNWSPFRIQVNEFEGGGIAVGVSCSHMHADLTCLTLIYKSWSDIHNHRPISHPPLFFDPNPTAPHNNNKTLPLITPSTTTTFKFSHAAIKKGLKSISSSCPAATPFDFLAALFFSRLRERSSLCICTDARTSTRSLPLGFYGNALNFSIISDDDNGFELGRLAKKIHDATAASKGPYRSGGFGPELTCVSMEHLAAEKVVVGDLGFGEGVERPVHVSYRIGGVVEEGVIVVAPSVEEGELSRVVVASLPAEELGELCEDEVVLGFEPVLMFKQIERD